MKFKFTLPPLTEAESHFDGQSNTRFFLRSDLQHWHYLSEGDESQIVDQHVKKLDMNDSPDAVAIEVSIANAYRAYQIADQNRKNGTFVILGGLHVTPLPDEAATHAMHFSSLENVSRVDIAH